jgi:hypothetical protein
MIEITIKAIKADVLNEVARTTAYEGKKASDEGAYERIFTTEEDRSMLQRFWDEAASSMTESLKRFVTSIDDSYTTNDGGTEETLPAYVANLALSSSYDTALTSSVEKSLFSYFVNAIVSKWNNFVKKDGVQRYEEEANNNMTDILSKLFYKKRPTRIKITH